MQFVHEVINYIGSQPASTWSTLGAYLAGSTVVASALQVVKHKFKFADAKKLIVFVMGFFSFLVAFADLLLQANLTHPLPQLGHVTGLLMAGAMVVHRFAVSPAYYAITAKAQRIGKLLDEVEQENTNLPLPAVALNALPEEANLAQFQLPA